VAKFVPTVNVPTYYYAYGDSITRATDYADLNLSGDDCYIMQMVSRNNNTRTASHNIDGGGQTSGWGLSNFESHFTPGTSIFVIEFGLNDLAKNVTAEVCAANLITMHEYAVSNGSACIVIVQTLMTDNGLSYRNLPTQREYISVIEAALDAESVQYIRGYDAVDTTPGDAVPDSPDLSVYAPDGVHLTVAGQALLGGALQ
jgi:lysophospholipase L1-like esterase